VLRALCVWQDPRTVVVFPSEYNDPSFDSLIAIGDVVMVKGNMLRAQCPQLASPEECEKWQTAQDVQGILAAPLRAVVPVVSISAPSVLFQCKGYVLDLTGSSGAGGRQWSHLEVNVSSVSDSNTSLVYRDEIEAFYRNHYTLSPPTPLPPEYLLGNETYVFEVTFCNFLFQCSTSMSTVRIVLLNELPVVSIAGRMNRQMRRADSLWLQASAFVGTCGEDNRFTGMKVNWQVSEAGVVSSELVSKSQNPFGFILPGGQLTVGSLYTITVIVIDEKYRRQSFATVSVTVVPSDVVAVISGGSVQSWRVGEAEFSLDGSGSYDLDTDFFELSYLWTCDQSQSKVALESSFCLLLLPSSIQRSDAIVLNHDLFANTTSVIGASVRFTLRIMGTSNRTDSASVLVSFTESTSPKIILSSPSSILSEQQLQIITSVEVAKSSGVVWSVSDSSVDLSAIAAIPSLSKRFEKPGVYSFTLVIRGASLEPGTIYDFVLSVGDDEGWVTSTVSVQVVQPPRSGQLVVTPLFGVEFADYFEFSTTRWSDDELPLTYSFGYFKIGDDNTMMELQSRGELAFMMEKYLPRGAAARNFNLSCGVYAFNTLNASSVQRQFVRVFAMQPEAEAFEATIISQLEKVFENQDINAVKSIVAVGVSILNMANCSLAPSQCSVLGREPCSNTPHSCGPCLQGFIGESTGDSNSACHSIIEAVSSVASVNGSCLDSVDVVDNTCAVMQVCMDGICVYPTKSCPSDCSGRGNCLFTSSGEEVAECRLNDFTCQAKCFCNEGFLGSGCSESWSDMQAKQRTRFHLISMLNSTVQMEDASSDSVTSRVRLIMELGSNPSELTPASCRLLQSVVADILNIAPRVDVPIVMVQGVLQVLENCDQMYLMKEYILGKSARLGVTELGISTFNTNKALRSTFSEVVSNSMVVGESYKEFVESHTRTAVAKTALSDVNMHKVPQSALEILFSQEKSGITFDGLEDVTSDFSRSIILEENDRELFSNTTEYSTNPLKIHMVLSTTSAGQIPPEISNQTVLITFQNTIPQLYITNSSDENATSVIRFVSDCAFPNVTLGSVANFTCPDGQVVSHRCVSKRDVITTTCPAMRVLPDCHLMSSSDAEMSSSSCQLLSFTSTQVVCNCTIMAQQVGRRRRLDAATSAKASGYKEVVAMSKYTYEGFIQTNSEVSELAFSDLENGIIVIVMFGALWGCGLLGLYELIRSSYFSCSSKVRPDKPSNIGKRQTSVAQPTVEVSLATKKQYLLKFIDDILPIVFRPSVEHDTTLQSLWKTIKTHHSYAVVLTANGPGTKDLKIRKGLYLLTIQAMLMFTMAVFCDLQFPADDGYCSAQLTRENCEARKSMFDQSVNTCSWKDESCTYKEVEFTVKVRIR
jgi:hypothetical protein